MKLQIIDGSTCHINDRECVLLICRDQLGKRHEVKISGYENYILLPFSPDTDEEQVIAMVRDLHIYLTRKYTFRKCPRTHCERCVEVKYPKFQSKIDEKKESTWLNELPCCHDHNDMQRGVRGEHDYVYRKPFFGYHKHPSKFIRINLFANFQIRDACFYLQKNMGKYLDLPPEQMELFNIEPSAVDALFLQLDLGSFDWIEVNEVGDLIIDVKDVKKVVEDIPIKNYYTMASWDIETISSKNGDIRCYPERDQIGMISIVKENSWDKGKRMRVLLHCHQEDILSWASEWTVVRFDTEVQMIEAYFQYTRDSDFIIAHNGNGFDIPYIVTRASCIGASTKAWKSLNGSGRPFRYVRRQRSSNQMKTVDTAIAEAPGKIMFDSYIWARCNLSLSRYNLNTFAKFCKIPGKVDMEYKFIYSIWHKIPKGSGGYSLQNLAEYCGIDSELALDCTLIQDSLGQTVAKAKVCRVNARAILDRGLQYLILTLVKRQMTKTHALPRPRKVKDMMALHDSLRDVDRLSKKLKRTRTEDDDGLCGLEPKSKQARTDDYDGLVHEIFEQEGLDESMDVVGDDEDEVEEDGGKPKEKRDPNDNAMPNGYLGIVDPFTYGTTGYPGAMVLEAKRGFYKKTFISVLDFASLYPSIMRAQNLCPSTIKSIKEFVDTWPIDPNSDYISINGYLFHRPKGGEEDGVGVFVLVLAMLMNERGKAKKKRDTFEEGTQEWKNFEQLQMQFKVASNSMYGMLGNVNSPLSGIFIAEAVTMEGKRSLLKCVELIDKLELVHEKGFGMLHVPPVENHMMVDLSEILHYQPEVIYGDTDSVFINWKNEDATREQILKISEKLEEVINDYLGFINPMSMEAEAIFKPALLDAQKKYAMLDVTKEGKYKPKIKGMAMVRRNYFPFLVTLMESIFDYIFVQGNTNLTDIAKFVYYGLSRLFYEKNLDKEEFMMTVNLSRPITEYKNPKNEKSVALVKMLERAGIHSQVGDRIPYLYRDVNYKAVVDQVYPYEIFEKRGMALGRRIYFSKCVEPLKSFLQNIVGKKLISILTDEAFYLNQKVGGFDPETYFNRFGEDSYVIDYPIVRKSKEEKNDQADLKSFMSGKLELAKVVKKQPKKQKKKKSRQTSTLSDWWPTTNEDT